MAVVEQGAGAPGRDAVAELERQVERGSMFTQAVFQKSFTRLSLLEAVVRELTGALVERGVLAGPEVDEARAALAPAPADAPAGPSGPAERGQAGQGTIPWPAVAVRVDPEDEALPEPVDCAARLPVCKAACCRLKFALSQEEIEVGRVKWDIGHPYIIRQDSSGYCCHNDPATHGCTVYDQRPGLCRRYSCRYDKRIWSDFDAMVLNTAWLNEHLAEADAILLVDADEEPAAAPAEPAAEP